MINLWKAAGDKVLTPSRFHDLRSLDEQRELFAGTVHANYLTSLVRCIKYKEFALAFKGSDDLVKYFHTLDDEGCPTGMLQDLIERVEDAHGNPVGWRCRCTLTPAQNASDGTQGQESASSSPPAQPEEEAFHLPEPCTSPRALRPATEADGSHFGATSSVPNAGVTASPAPNAAVGAPNPPPFWAKIPKSCLYQLHDSMEEGVEKDELRAYIEEYHGQREQ